MRGPLESLGYVTVERKEVAEIIKIQIPPKGSRMWHVGGTQPSLLRTAGEAVLSGDRCQF